MMLPDFADKDAVLEYAAQLIEDADITDWAGAWAKRKRDREDADLRFKTAQEVRAKCAKHVRAFKTRPDLDAKTILRHLSELPTDRQHGSYLKDAWPLAWKGWVDIECRIRCNSNSFPPETEYRIHITEKGRKALNGAAA